LTDRPNSSTETRQQSGTGRENATRVETVPSDELDKAFRALADPNRRALLDALYARNGQTLSELSRQLSHMTRLGAMKHLPLLADASLVISDKIGRERLHYLNSVPIRSIYEHWIRKYEL
jgi:DNA-binding transcriptional ArsR family regulator